MWKVLLGGICEKYFCRTLYSTYTQKNPHPPNVQLHFISRWGRRQAYPKIAIFNIFSHPAFIWFKGLIYNKYYSYRVFLFLFLEYLLIRIHGRSFFNIIYLYIRTYKLKLHNEQVYVCSCMSKYPASERAPSYLKYFNTYSIFSYQDFLKLLLILHFL